MCTDWKAQSVLCLGEHQNKACGYTHKDLILTDYMGYKKWSLICQGGRGGRGGWWSRLPFHTIVLLGIWCPDNTEILHPSGVTGSQQRQVNGRKGQEQTKWAQYVHVGFLFLLSPLMTSPTTGSHHWKASCQTRIALFDSVIALLSHMQPAPSVAKL